MARKSPRSRKKTPGAPRVPASPRVRSAPGKGRIKSGGRAGRARKDAHAKPTAPRPAAAAARKRKAAPSAAAKRRATRAPRFIAPDPVRVGAVLEQLRELYPDAKCALNFETPLQLLIATILSAQCTDARVNMTTPALFAKYPSAAAFAAADTAELEAMVRSTGFFRMKAKAVREACADIVKKHGGEVPRTLEALTALRGVGRKTANVVLGNAYGVPGLVVDTHVTRLANRLALTNERDAVKIEFALMPIVPRESWTLFSHWLILHGRQVCNARKPRCSDCPLLPHCPRVGVTVSA